MSAEKVTKLAKDYRLDVLRVIAMVMVVFVHVANYYCRAYPDITSASYLGAVIYNAISRVSVPVFFMISGMLLLRKPVDLKKNAKRIKGKIIYLVIVTAVYLVWDILYMKKANINFWGLVSNPERKLLWFMYAIIAIYIALPFLRRMVENMSAKEDLLFVILWASLNGGVHLLRCIIKFNVVYPIPIINGTYYLGYFIIGYLIWKYAAQIKELLLLKNNKIIATSVCILSFAVTILITYITSLNTGSYFQYFFQYKSLFMIISSVSFFVLVYFGCKNKENKIIAKLASNSFEVYLFHGIALDFFMHTIPFKYINGFLGVPLLAVLVLTITFLGICLVKRIVFLIKARSHAT